MDLVTYGEQHQKAIQGLVHMLLDVKNPLVSFKKDKYAEAFQAYLQQHMDVIEGIESLYQEAEDPGQLLETLAEHLVHEAKQVLEGIPKKSKRSDQLIDYNMTLAIYVFPALLEPRNMSSDPLTDAIIQRWNTTFKTSIGKANFDRIDTGFRSRLCYITTAVCESQGKPDNCYELELLRSYRDDYLLSTEDGQALVKEYYDIAPTIVNRIAQDERSRAIYEKIWETYLSPCIQLIEAGKNEACKTRYMDMVYELKGRYMA